jgi:anti-sigma regulatory factor (Ser/Thr protein kinase)
LSFSHQEYFDEAIYIFYGEKKAHLSLNTNITFLFGMHRLEHIATMAQTEPLRSILATTTNGSTVRYFEGNQGDFKNVVAQLASDMRTHGYDENGDEFGITLCFTEAWDNANIHGNQRDPLKKIRVIYSINSHRFKAIIQDEGNGFHKEEVPDCTTDDRLEIDHGRGTMLMDNYMDRAEH